MTLRSDSIRTPRWIPHARYCSDGVGYVATTSEIGERVSEALAEIAMFGTRTMPYERFLDLVLVFELCTWSFVLYPRDQENVTKYKVPSTKFKVQNSKTEDQSQVQD